MARKTKALLFITIMVVSLSVAFIAVFQMKPCEYCGEMFCFGRCTIDYGQGGTIDDGITRPNKQTTNQNTTQLALTERADESYINNITFVGDSRTMGLKLVFDYIDDSQIFAEDGLNHEDAMTKKVVPIQQYKNVSIPDAVKITAPSTIIVNFGINGIAWMTPDNLVEGYEKLIDELIINSPNSIIIIESIMPVALSYENNVTNEKIDEANAQLFQMAKRKGLYYLATADVMKNDMNDLDDAYHRADGIHFTNDAYQVIMEYILTHAVYKEQK